MIFLTSHSTESTAAKKQIQYLPKHQSKQLSRLLINQIKKLEYNLSNYIILIWCTILDCLVNMSDKLCLKYFVSSFISAAAAAEVRRFRR